MPDIRSLGNKVEHIGDQSTSWWGLKYRKYLHALPIEKHEIKMARFGHNVTNLKSSDENLNDPQQTTSLEFDRTRFFG